MKITQQVKDYLADPDSYEMFYIEIRIDFESIKSEDNGEILELFNVNFQKLRGEEDFLEGYYSYEDKKIIIF
tara:strand:+ start:745 stop:960 length:216 start_codon:yes stop_codon:yes gene_type:complete